MQKILKFYFEPDEKCHEIKTNGYIVDVKNGDGITEIQTRGMSRLIPKLEHLLPEHRITVVYPLEYNKYIRWIDRESGEISERRKSPKTATVFDSVWEFYNIRRFIGDKNLSLKLVFLSVEEFRYKNAEAFGRLKKKVRAERIPMSLERVVEINSAEDFRIFVPDGLCEEFTAADFNRAVGGRFSYG